MSFIISETIGSSLQLRLNRPDKKNALNRDMYLELTERINEAQSNDGVATIVISAEGADFCAGNDIADFAKGVASGEMFAGKIEDVPVFQFLKAITYLDKPMLAAVQGQAVGIGTTWLLHCDCVIASDSLKLKLPFIQLGLVPEAASSQLLVQKMGYLRAFEWLTQRPFLNATEAMENRLINKIVDYNDLTSSIFDVSRRLEELPQLALRQSKYLMRKPDEIWEIIVAEGKIFRERLQSKEAQQAFMSFLSK